MKLVNSFFILSEALRLTKRPSNPTILVEGINNTDQDLVWEFLKEGDVVQSVQFQRNKPGESKRDTIASRLDSGGFTVFDPFKTDYDARLLNILKLKRVTNNQEYLYSIVINYVKDSSPQQPLSDEVQVMVQGKNLFLVLVFNKIEVTIASVSKVLASNSSRPFFTTALLTVINVYFDHVLGTLTSTFFCCFYVKRHLMLALFAVILAFKC